MPLISAPAKSQPSFVQHTARHRRYRNIYDSTTNDLRSARSADFRPLKCNYKRRSALSSAFRTPRKPELQFMKLFTTLIITLLIHRGVIADSYHEPFRPQFHFTPAKNWIND